jgi:hypothetical protein
MQKGELPQHRFQHWLQPGFTDLRCSSHHFLLRQLIDRVDVIHAFDSLGMALVHRVHSDLARLAVRLRPPLADGYLRRPRPLVSRFVRYGD